LTLRHPSNNPQSRRFDMDSLAVAAGGAITALAIIAYSFLVAV
jgi:hypothetical protein